VSAKKSRSDLDKKVDEYKKKLDEELEQVINDEKELETERQNKYDEETDEDVKKELEEDIVVQRKLTEEKLSKLNQ